MRKYINNKKHCNKFGTLILAGVIAILLFSPVGINIVAAQDDAIITSNDGDLSNLTLEDLINVVVVSASKHEQKLSDTAAAICVITQEDIRRSGLTSIPELLRMATGMQVAHIDSSKWAISSRGFTDRFSNKLLVLIDGRSVYTPFFSGVWWDVQDSSLEDIDRIEIIRGPGAALWGANAVNGIINIITKGTDEISGNRLAFSAELSDDRSDRMTVRGKAGNTSYRIYSRNSAIDGFVDALGQDTPDEWNQRRVGFRVDIQPSERDNITIQGDSYKGQNQQILSRFTLTEPYYEPYLDDGEFAGNNYLARFTHKFTETSSAQIQMYYDRTYRKDGLHEEERKTVDVDFQHNFAWGPKHKFVWGLGYRMSKDNLVGNEYIWFSLPSEKEYLYSWFVQDEIIVVPDKFRFILGTKVEDNYYTGYEIQPNVRALWQPNEKQTVWSAVSRAVRTPSRLELDCSRNEGVGYVTDEGVPVVYITTANPNLESEKLTAYELGYRVQPSDKLSIDAAAFYNVYDDFRSYDAGIPYSVPLPAPHIVQPLLLNNSMNAKTYGLELTLNYRPADYWRISACYTGIKITMKEDPGHIDPVQATYAKDTPRNQFNIRSYWDLPNNFELDTMVYYVGKLPHYKVPAYTRVDIRLGWRPSKKIEYSVGVRNLLDSHHIEFGRTYTEFATEVERKFYAKVTRRF